MNFSEIIVCTSVMCRQTNISVPYRCVLKMSCTLFQNRVCRALINLYRKIKLRYFKRSEVSARIIHTVCYLGKGFLLVIILIVIFYCLRNIYTVSRWCGHISRHWRIAAYITWYRNRRLLTWRRNVSNNLSTALCIGIYRRKVRCKRLSAAS